MQILFKKPVRVCMHVCLPSKKKIRRGGGECFIYISLSLVSTVAMCTLQLHRTRKASLMRSRIGTGYFIYLQKCRVPVARSRSVFPTGAGRVRFFSNSRVSLPRPSLNIHSMPILETRASGLSSSSSPRLKFSTVDRWTRTHPPFSAFRSRIPCAINILSVSLRLAHWRFLGLRCLRGLRFTYFFVSKTVRKRKLLKILHRTCSIL